MEINGKLELANLTADPSSPVEGMLYYNSTSKVLKIYDGSTWNDLGGAGEPLVELTGTKLYDNVIPISPSWKTMLTHTPPSPSEAPKLALWIVCYERDETHEGDVKVTQGATELLYFDLANNPWNSQDGEVIIDNTGEDILVQVGMADGSNSAIVVHWGIFKVA